MIQTLDLKVMGLEPMTEQEKIEIDGGWWQAIAAGLAISLADNFSDLIDGIKDGFHGK